jgi:hypothetical protein
MGVPHLYRQPLVEKLLEHHHQERGFGAGAHFS